MSSESEGRAQGATPEVSVVMPVRDGRAFLDESVGSILAQTFRDFEFVILDDASLDGTAEALREWARRDARIRVIESPRRLGLSG
nr:glycosyltransferase [Acidobacteriota bacterium]